MHETAIVAFVAGMVKVTLELIVSHRQVTHPGTGRARQIIP